MLDGTAAKQQQQPKKDEHRQSLDISSSPPNIRDAREKIQQSRERPRHFSRIVFSDSSPTQDKVRTSTSKGTSSSRANINAITTQTQTQSAES